MNDDATALRLARQALALARRHGFERGELMVLSDLSRVSSSLQDLPQAERWAQELQRRAWATSPALQSFRIVALQTLATVAVAQQNEPRALVYLRQALALLPKVDPQGRFPLLSLLTYYGLSEIYTSRVTNLPHPADSLTRLARLYAGNFAAQARQCGHKDMLANAYLSLGRLSHQTDSAAYYLSRAVGLYRAMSHLGKESYAYAVWADMALLNRQYLLAETKARQALALTHSAPDPIQESEVRDILAEALVATGRGAEAYRQAKRAHQLHDSATQLNNNAQLQALQVQFDTQQKDGRIQALTQQQAAQRSRARAQQQQLWFLGIALTIVAVGAAAVSVLALRLRRSRAQLAMQHHQLAAQHEELTHTRATQDRLYALVAHDLRSPVVAFAGLADLLHSYVQQQDTEALTNLGGYIRQAARNLSELLDNLLNWALSQRGELLPVLQPVRVQELLAETAAMYQHSAAEARIRLAIEAPVELGILADPNMTRTILRNLVSNALKATPKDGKVTLRARRETNRIHLQVTDTGGKLSPEMLSQLEMDAARLRVADLTHSVGLGLLLSRAFARAQGGTLRLANDATGLGVCAQLDLPAIS
ncbi:HAMP domain-containing sensor histidine kinase [Hymenobacter sp. M29]|uniref:histidine kinase n=1 Tax=Hymenobacter mellowenesis TaxID=3063995 RepID=A0ABT9AFC3_9BACT|nr:HAMP domain-containing sensor histidine kinase [Hymenobacter sp. M29]MDO7848577.1 HAMP domain-containing sensor histidine kinase [Hymenobacter sp. M29]